MEKINMRLVIIEWIDSYGVGSEWESLDNIIDESHICISVGYLAMDGKNIKVVIPHISPANDIIGAKEKGCGDMAIPACSIIKTTDLIEVDK